MSRLWAKIIATVLSAVIISASGAVIGVKINDAVQDTKIDGLIKKVDKNSAKLDRILEKLPY